MFHTHPNQSSGPNIHFYNRYWVSFLSIKSPGQGIDHPTLLVLTPWNRDLLEKLLGFQLVKKFPAFYGT